MNDLNGFHQVESHLLESYLIGLEAQLVSKIIGQMQGISAIEDAQ